MLEPPMNTTQGSIDLRELEKRAETSKTQRASQCRCPVRPRAGSWASGSATDAAALNRWEAEHLDHPYSKARDVLSTAIEIAESDMRLTRHEKPGEAVIDMVADIFGLHRGMADFRPSPSGVMRNAAYDASGHTQHAKLGDIVGSVAQQPRAPGKMFSQEAVLAIVRAEIARLPAETCNEDVIRNNGARRVLTSLETVFENLE